VPGSEVLQEALEGLEDARGGRDRQIASVEAVLDEIGASELPRLLVLNKADRCSEEERRRLRNRRPDAVLASALNGEGLLDIERAIGEHFAGRFEHVALLVPFDQGGVLAELYALGSPIVREDTAEGVLIRAHLPHALAERYASFRLVPTGA